MASPVNSDKNETFKVRVAWNQEPTKQLVKDTYSGMIEVARDAVTPAADALANRMLGENPANRVIVGQVLDRAEAGAKKVTHAIADTAYKNSDSCGSSIAQWLGFSG